MRSLLFTLIMLTLVSVGCRTTTEDNSNTLNAPGDGALLPNGIEHYAGKTMTCSMSDRDARPYLMFFMDFDSRGKASVRYQKSAFFGSEEMQVVQDLQGFRSKRVSYRPRSIYIEGDGDGDAGYATIEREGDTYSGVFAFPESGPAGYGDDARLPVTCNLGAGTGNSGGEDLTNKMFSCSMIDTNSRPWLMFVINFSSSSQANVQYVRSAFFGSEERVFPQDLDGFQPARVDARRDNVYLEGDGDGDAGYASLRKSGNQYVGHFTFPESGPEGFGDDSRLDVRCAVETGAMRDDLQGRNMICAMSDTSARPWLQFMLDFTTNTTAHVKYQKSAFFGSEEFPAVRDLSGFTPARVDREATSLYVEGDGDGDAGFASLEKSGNGYRGSFKFPESGPEGYGDDTSLDVNCSWRQ